MPGIAAQACNITYLGDRDQEPEVLFKASWGKKLVRAHLNQ
jgi:hypothetical protein